MVRRVVDSGISLIDTANDYGNSEEMIGLAISDRYSEVTVSTKCGCSPSGHIWTRDNLFRGVHESLERLKTDRIDIMQFHGGSVREFEENDTVRALLEMREQGLVKWIGASTNLPHLPTLIDWGVFDIFQLPYSALDRTHEEWITKAAESGAGVLIRGGVALGEPGVGKGSHSEWQAFRRSRPRCAARGGREPYGVRPALRGEPSIRTLQPRGHHQPHSLAGEHRGDDSWPPARRRVRRGEATYGRHRSNSGSGLNG